MLDMYFLFLGDIELNLGFRIMICNESFNFLLYYRLFRYGLKIIRCWWWR